MWVVKGTKNGMVELVSLAERDSVGILPIGSYLTATDKETKIGKEIKHILRVENSLQHETYSPSPIIIESGLKSLTADQKCQNIISTTRITEFPKREDGMNSFIKPQIKARRSNQDEIDISFGNKKGMPVFPATVFERNSQHLYDESGKFMQVKIPDDVFFHQMLIAGRTGSGKTVAMKYLSQYFIEEMGDDEKKHKKGAVLAINVKEEDLLTMDKASNTNRKQVKKEWSDIGLEPHGIETFRIYYPGNQIPKYSNNVNHDKCEKITLNTEDMDPDSLVGLIQNISDRGAEQLPAIFRYWKTKIMKPGDSFNKFVGYFGDPNRNKEFTIMNERHEIFEIKMFHGTYQNVLNALTNATSYFDIEGAKELNSDDILQPGKMSVIDVTGKNGMIFGSVLLRDLLNKIYNSKSNKENDTPVLIIIDEVHEFYGTARSREALSTLDSICRKGRSLEIGVIFSSQNPEDVPKGISSVVNSKIYFKSDISNMRTLGVNVSGFDPEALKIGYGIARIHGLNQLKFVKFPMSLSGVNDEKRD